ncbi:unnamed protein product [Tilletia caries]|nr:unnamed protein product [Tilletia caries]
MSFSKTKPSRAVLIIELCFALKAGGAPSFRPSFRYFNLWTSGGGALACLGSGVQDRSATFDSILRSSTSTRSASRYRRTPSPGNAPYLVLVLVQSVRFTSLRSCSCFFFSVHFAICSTFLPDARKNEKSISTTTTGLTGSDVDPQRGSGFLSSAAVVRSSLSHEQVPSVLPFVKSTVSAHTTIPTSRPTNAIALLSWVLNKGQHPRPQATLALVGKGTAPRTGGPLFMMIKGRGGWEAN